MATLAEALVQTFLPATCQLCRRSLPLQGSRGGVCASCWQQVHGFGNEWCPVCGAPDTALRPCLACREVPPPWFSAASYGSYEGRLKELIALLKSSRRDELAAPLAQLLETAWRRQSWPRPDHVVPVPIWWGRLLSRGFDQSALLAQSLAKLLDVPFSNVLRRRRAARQVGKGRADRLRLPANAFALRRPVSGKVLLVDDVLTTGATVAACSRHLAAGGADEVFVLTLARTP